MTGVKFVVFVAFPSTQPPPLSLFFFLFVSFFKLFEMADAMDIDEGQEESLSSPEVSLSVFGS